MTAFLGSLARLLCTLGLIALFFLFVVRPLLNYLIVSRQIEARKRLYQATAEEAEPPEPSEEAMPSALLGSGLGAEAEPGGLPPRPRGMADREALERLATSSPDKAGDLVKKWVHSE